MTPQYPKRLIEVDLPIARISAHARREKSIRHGHISTLHIWWARRPLAACRAVICAALWPDPADPLCPQAFRDEAARLINAFAKQADGDMKLLATSSEESKTRWAKLVKAPLDSSDAAALPVLRAALLDFIADFANWDNSTVKEYLETSRALTQAAHEALGGAPGTRPLVVDPFAGGGSIPLEALRVGADAFASDLNPIPVLLNKVVLEYIPKYGQRLADEVRKWGAWISNRAKQELAEFFPKDSDGATPIAYLWARTILSESPGQGDIPVEVPLIRSMWLSQRGRQRLAMRWKATGEQLVCDVTEVAYADGTVRKVRRPQLEFFEPKTETDVPRGTVARGSATCPVTGYTTPVQSVRDQLKARSGGASDARIFAVVCTCAGSPDYVFRHANEADYLATANAERELKRKFGQHEGYESVPNEPTPLGGGRGAGRAFSQRNYGMDRFRDLFTPRQLLSLATYARLIREAGVEIEQEEDDAPFAAAVQTLLGFALNKGADYWTSIAGWMPRGTVGHAFHRQAIQIIWDFAEAVPICDFHCAWHETVKWVSLFAESCARADLVPGHVEQSDATSQPLPSDSAACLFTDPPYYDAVPYADLSDFFLVWLKRSIGSRHTGLFQDLSPKDAECIVDDAKGKGHAFFESTMTKSLTDSRRTVSPNGVGVVVFAHKSTSGWESQLQSILSAGWTITGSWPIDTERGARLRAMDSAALASSVHLVCRPREDASGALRDEIGEWRDVLSELPKRIHEWMPRLASEGVVGADAIFACLGPALEVFSRYSRVEKASGEAVPLREYLEQVWAAVATEALSMIFKEADAAGLEPDARLTAMWLWTLGSGGNGGDSVADDEAEPDEGDDKESSGSGKAVGGGFTLEYDAARKIAQGLGVHLEEIESVVEVKGDKARLRPVAERTKHLFGKDEAAPTAKRRKKKSPQKTLFEDLEETEAVEGGWSEMKGPALGETVLDRVHQAMILFAAGRTDAIKRFLVEDGAGTDARFWKLAQSLSALYPKDTDEKRWVDGVLARKKGWGF